jgi:hypothetical protein
VRAIETKKTQTFYPIAQEQYQLHLQDPSQIRKHNQQSVAVETKEQRVLNTQNRNQSRTKNKDLFISRTLWRNQSLSGQQRQIEWDQNWGDWSRHERNMSRTKTLLQKQWAPIGSGTLLATWMKISVGATGENWEQANALLWERKWAGGTHTSHEEKSSSWKEQVTRRIGSWCTGDEQGPKNEPFSGHSKEPTWNETKTRVGIATTTVIKARGERTDNLAQKLRYTCWG